VYLVSQPNLLKLALMVLVKWFDQLMCLQLPGGVETVVFGVGIPVMGRSFTSARTEAFGCGQTETRH